MNIVIDTNNLVALATVNIPTSDYKQSVTDKLNEYAKNIKLKGFRPGKVSQSVVKQIYGKDILARELVSISESFLMKYIKENKINHILSPMLFESNLDDGIHFEKNYWFKYKIGLATDFNLDESLNTSVNNFVVDSISDDFANDFLENIRLEYSSHTDAEVSTKHSILKGFLTLENSNVKVPFSIYTDNIKESKKNNFIGCEVEDSLSTKLSDTIINKFALSTIFTTLYKKNLDPEIEYKFIIKKIWNLELIDFDEQLYDKVSKILNIKSKINNKEEITSAIKEYLITKSNRESEILLNNEITTSLLENTEIKLPDDFIKDFVGYKNVDNADNKVSSEYNDYIKKIKWGCICKKIMDELEVKVSDEEIIHHVNDLLKPYFSSDMLDSKVKEFLQSPKNYEDIYSYILSNKIFDAIKSKIKIKKVAIPIEEFNSLVYKKNNKNVK